MGNRLEVLETEHNRLVWERNKVERQIEGLEAVIAQLDGKIIDNEIAQASIEQLEMTNWYHGGVL